MAITEQEIKSLIAKTLDVKIDIIDNELAIGDIPEWDSLAHLRIIMAIEKELGIRLEIEETIEIEDVEDIIDAVQSHA